MTAALSLIFLSVSAWTDAFAQASAAAKTRSDFFMSSSFKSSVGEISGIGSHLAFHKERHMSRSISTVILLLGIAVIRDGGPCFLTW